ncbi:retrovirus-related pol polyprotein from transposon TNT 1-94 [Tanacetum coccineum]|uniref:Retrovirus-related pol polyprotein from transposon TNT 1-94 n=1 Tax=Tanacetum coccineum TaxID=301880 RepID=A0ABQ5IDU6_9ASTR
MLEENDYESWKIRIERYIKGKTHEDAYDSDVDDETMRAAASIFYGLIYHQLQLYDPSVDQYLATNDRQMFPTEASPDSLCLIPTSACLILLRYFMNWTNKLKDFFVPKRIVPENIVIDSALILLVKLVSCVKECLEGNIPVKKDKYSSLKDSRMMGMKPAVGLSKTQSKSDNQKSRVLPSKNVARPKTTPKYIRKTDITVAPRIVPQWKPTGRQFLLCDIYGPKKSLTPIAKPLELSSSVSSSSPTTVIFRLYILSYGIWIQGDLFAYEMNSTFKMSMMGQMSFFLGLQISQNPRGIFINQAKYALEILKKYALTQAPITLNAKPTEMHLHAIKRIFRYLKGTLNMGLWYPKDSGFALTAFADADYAGC